MRRLTLTEAQYATLIETLTDAAEDLQGAIEFADEDDDAEDLDEMREQLGRLNDLRSAIA